jgi:hypothetical protein
LAQFQAWGFTAPATLRIPDDVLAFAPSSPPGATGVAAATQKASGPEQAPSEEAGAEVLQSIPGSELKLQKVPDKDLHRLRLVDTPRVGSCLYSCIYLGKAKEEEVYEWLCQNRRPNGTAKDDEREKVEKQLALDVAKLYKADVDPEVVPESHEYILVAQACKVTLDVHVLHHDGCFHFLINEGHPVIKVLLATTGVDLRTATGHFDFLYHEPINLQHSSGSSGQFGS